MNLADFKSRIKSGNVGGRYIFAGEEDYLKRYYRSELQRAVVTDEAFATFNHTVFDGQEMQIAALRDALYAPPMMADYKLIEWRHADLDKMKESDRTALLKLFESNDDFPYAVIAISALSDGFDVGTEKRRSKLYTKLSEVFDILVFDKSTDAQLASWLKKHFDAERLAIDAVTLNTMIFRVGHSMQVLKEEVTKLSSYAKANGKTSVTVEDVNEICSATAECDAFAISNAIIEKNVERAFIALTEMKQQRVEPQAVMAMLTRTYGELVSISLLMDEGKGADDIASITKFHPYRLKLYMNAAKKVGTRRLADSLSELVRIDAESKAGGITGYKTVEMFITQNI